MKGTHQLVGDSASAEGSVGLDAVVPARDRAEPTPLPASAGSNVLPFVRPRAEAPSADSAPAVVIKAVDRPAPDVGAEDARAWLLALLALSLMLHAGIYVLANREPEPMASVSLETISVDIVFGDNSAPQQPDAQPAEPEKTETTTPTEQATAPEPQQTTTVPEQTAPEPQQPPPPGTTTTPPEPTPLEPQPPPPETATAPPSPTQPEPQQAPPPPPEPPSVAPVPEPPKPEPPKQETKPPVPKPQPPIKPAPVKPAPKHETKPAPKHEAKPKAAPKREVTRTEKPGPRANAANGGRASSAANDANYRGLVASHLARYKRFPPEAQRSGAQGSASVRFTVSGSGGVSSVSLVRGTGVAALDQEAVAMVRRASPFPAPPNGRPVSFTVPVSYKMR